MLIARDLSIQFQTLKSEEQLWIKGYFQTFKSEEQFWIKGPKSRVTKIPSASIKST